MWYFICFLAGLLIGYVIKDLISPEIVIKGKVKQKGRGNNLTVKPDIEVKKRRLKRKKRDKKKATN